MTTNKDIVIIGAGGQSKNTSLIIEQTKDFNILGFADDDPQKKGQIIRNYPVLGTIKEICQNYDNISFAFAIGNPNIVQKIAYFLKNYQQENQKTFHFPNIIHPTAQIDFNEVKLGEGNIIFPNTLFLAEITIGNFNFINFNTAISHEAKIGNFTCIQPGVNILGKTIIQDKAYIGANSTVINAKTIAKNATIGAGAVVTKDVEENAIMVGNPAKLLRYKEN